MARQEKEVTKLQIELATIELFGTQSYQNISMDEIAKKAGVSKRTLYKYFPSKVELFISIFEQRLRQLITDEGTPMYEGMSFSDVLISQFTALYEFTNEHVGFMKLFWMVNSDSFGSGTPAELAEHVLLLNNRILENAAKQLAEKTPTGIFKDMSPTLITQMYSALNKGVFMQAEKEARIGIHTMTQDELFHAACDMLRRCAEQ